MTRYVLSAEARRDLFEIWNYLAELNIDAADRVAAELDAGMKRIARTPGLGHRRDDLAVESLRFYRVRAYLIIYRPNSKPLSVVRILHSARDVRTLLDDE